MKMKTNVKAGGGDHGCCCDGGNGSGNTKQTGIGNVSLGNDSGNLYITS